MTEMKYQTIKLQREIYYKIFIYVFSHLLAFELMFQFIPVCPNVKIFRLLYDTIKFLILMVCPPPNLKTTNLKYISEKGI